MFEMLPLVNVIICISGLFVTYCRLAKMSPDTKPLIRLQYITWVILFSVSLLTPFLGWVELVITGCGLLILLAGFKAWKHGAPPYTDKVVR